MIPEGVEIAYFCFGRSGDGPYMPWKILVGPILLLKALNGLILPHVVLHILLLPWVVLDVIGRQPK